MAFDLNTHLQNERTKKEGKEGAKVRAQIASKLAEAQRLEQQRGLDAKGAMLAVQKATQLRTEAGALQAYLGSPQFEIISSVINRQSDEATLLMFSDLQSQYIEEQAARQSQVNALMSNAVNFLIGTDTRDLERQINRLLDNGEDVLTDNKGNKYVRFELAETAGNVNRAIMTPEGQVGFVVEARSAGQAGE